jgi:hypothetical protein
MLAQECFPTVASERPVLKKFWYLLRGVFKDQFFCAFGCMKNE